MDLKKKGFFRLFSNCIPVKGAMCSVICDIQSNEIIEISNFQFDLLEKIQKKPIQDIFHELPYSKDHLSEFTSDLVNQNLGFYTDHPEYYPKIDLQWKSPYKIHNAVIECSKIIKENFENILFEIDRLGCQGVQLILENYSSETLTFLLKRFKDKRIKYIELVLNYSPLLKMNKYLENIFIEHPRLRIIKSFNSPEEKVLNSENKFLDKKVLFFLQDLYPIKKEQISKVRFVNNIHTFSEAQNYNLGLNRKITIDGRGQIKNFLTNSKVYGNIFKARLADIVATAEFGTQGSISNDKIEICRDCQYRYSCVNNSEIVKKQEKHYRINRCDFDPYLNCWN